MLVTPLSSRRSRLLSQTCQYSARRPGSGLHLTVRRRAGDARQRQDARRGDLSPATGRASCPPNQGPV